MLLLTCARLVWLLLLLSPFNIINVIAPEGSSEDYKLIRTHIFARPTNIVAIVRIKAKKFLFVILFDFVCVTK